MKRCSKCGEEKSLDAFHRNRANKDGRAYYCRDCWRPEARKAARKYRARHPSRARESNRRHYRKHTAKRRAQGRRYHKENKDKRALAWKRYYEANREQLLAKAKVRYEANREAILAQQRANYDPGRRTYNPEVHRRATARRRARMHGTLIADVTFDEIVIRDLGVCGICNQPVMEPAELDHVIPLAAGGTHEPDNIQFAHRTCNRRKAARIN
jgi:site-specific DNA-cytosine methylase